jgi:hypothetical protein
MIGSGIPSIHSNIPRPKPMTVLLSTDEMLGINADCLRKFRTRPGRGFAMTAAAELRSVALDQRARHQRPAVDQHEENQLEW